MDDHKTWRNAPCRKRLVVLRDCALCFEAAEIDSSMAILPLCFKAAKIDSSMAILREMITPEKQKTAVRCAYRACGLNFTRAVRRRVAEVRSPMGSHVEMVGYRVVVCGCLADTVGGVPAGPGDVFAVQWLETRTPS